MTKKDFELIASVIKPLEIDFKGFIASCFADALASKNPRFNKDKFLKACGVEVDDNKCKYCIDGYNPNCIYCKGSRYIE